MIIYKNMPYVQVKTDKEYSLALEKHGPGLVIVKASASWCGPCKAIAPFFKELGDDSKQALFISVDVDECMQTAANLGISSLPTFIFLKEEKEIDRFSGSNKTKLTDTLKQYV